MIMMMAILAVAINDLSAPALLFHAVVSDHCRHDHICDDDDDSVMTW